MGKRISRINQLSKEEFKTLVDNSDTIVGVLRSLGYKNHSGSLHNAVKKRIHEDSLSSEHMKVLTEKVNSNGSSKIPLDEILVENSTYTNRYRLKLRLVNEGVLEYKCSGENCGNIGEWLGKPLTLQLEHKNGINNDNRLENLQFLCPNCHSQTKTFSGRNMGVSHSGNCN